MINFDRIVPVTATDLISLYGLILTVSGVEVIPLEAVNPAEFEQPTTAKTVLANEPLKSLDFGSNAATGTVYFVAAYNYVGFTKNGEDLPVTGDVSNDGRTLYKATLASNAITVEKVGF